MKEIARYEGLRGGAFPSASQLAKDTGFSEAVVLRAIRQAMGLNLLATNPRKRGRTFRLNWEVIMTCQGGRGDRLPRSLRPATPVIMTDESIKENKKESEKGELAGQVIGIERNSSQKEEGAKGLHAAWRALGLSYPLGDTAFREIWELAYDGAASWTPLEVPMEQAIQIAREQGTRVPSEWFGLKKSARDRGLVKPRPRQRAPDEIMDHIRRRHRLAASTTRKRTRRRRGPR